MKSEQEEHSHIKDEDLRFYWGPPRRNLSAKEQKKLTRISNHINRCIDCVNRLDLLVQTEGLYTVSRTEERVILEALRGEPVIGQKCQD